MPVPAPLACGISRRRCAAPQPKHKGGLQHGLDAPPGLTPTPATWPMPSRRCSRSRFHLCADARRWDSARAGRASPQRRAKRAKSACASTRPTSPRLAVGDPSAHSGAGVAREPAGGERRRRCAHIRRAHWHGLPTGPATSPTPAVSPTAVPPLVGAGTTFRGAGPTQKRRDK